MRINLKGVTMDRWQTNAELNTNWFHQVVRGAVVALNKTNLDSARCALRIARGGPRNESSQLIRQKF